MFLFENVTNLFTFHENDKYVLQISRIIRHEELTIYRRFHYRDCEAAI